MLETLSSDLKEFASCVSTDTTSAATVVAKDAIGVLDKIDETMGTEKPSDEQQEALYRMALREVYMTPLSLEDDDEDEVLDKEVRAFEEGELASFLKTFNISEMTEDISSNLEMHEALRALFEELVPVEVPYAEFWQRYYYRCDPSRIARAWAFQKEIDSKTMNAKLNVVKDMVVTPVSYLASHIISPLSAVVSLASPRDSDDEAKCTTAELKGLQHAITTSNQRIADLRMNLDETRRRLEATEHTSKSLERELASAKAALCEKEGPLAGQIGEITISVRQDDTSRTAESTQVSGIDDSANDESDNNSEEVKHLMGQSASSFDSPNGVADHNLEKPSSKLIEAEAPTNNSADDSSVREDVWANDKDLLDSEIELLMW